MPRTPAPPPAVGAAIRAARVARGWTQEDLALLLGCTKARVSALERGTAKGRPGIDLLRRVAAALDRAAADLDPDLARAAAGPEALPARSLILIPAEGGGWAPFGADSEAVAGEIGHRFGDPAGPAVEACLRHKIPLLIRPDFPELA